MALGAACGAEPVERGAAPAPTAPRVTLHVEPPVLRIGDVATLEIVVVTPPEHRVRPISPPEVEGIWLLDSEALPVNS